MRNLNIFYSIILSGLLFYQPAFSQDNEFSYNEIENTQDEIESIYMAVYDLIAKYPEASYNYIYEDGHLSEVKVTGIDNNRDSKMLEVHLIDLEELKTDINNVANRTGIYYATEKSAEPVNGWENFYDNVWKDLKYPEKAYDNGIEGVVFVKFIVDSDGEITKITAAEKVESSLQWVVNDMKEAAVDAIKNTSGDWEPAKVAGIPVAEYMVIPVQFTIENAYFTPLY